MPTETYDFIVVGAGSAGCVLANRLTKDPSIRVLVLEAGPEDRNIWLRIPAGVPKVVGHPKLTWGYLSDEEPGLENRRIIWPRGKTLGGSSSINGHVYMRGVPADYDAWRDMGSAGWAWEDILPYFKRGECHFLGASALHGGDGELHVSPLYEPHPASQAFVEAAVRCGIPRNDDFNGATQEGVGYLQFAFNNGERDSTSTAFLKPVRHRTNLVLKVNALAESVLLDNDRAIGVRYSVDGVTQVAHAGEVILAGGAINTPQLLMLSGIGPREHLESLGIAVKHALSDVGRNLQDHIYAHCLAKVEPSFSINKTIASNWRMIPDVLRYIASRRGLLTSAAAQVGLFTRSTPDKPGPDLQVQMRPFSMISTAGMYKANSEPMVTASVTLLRPCSVGAVTLRSTSPKDPPRMVANYLSDKRDIPPLIAGIRLIRSIFGESPFREHFEGEALPGTQYASDEEMTRYLRRNAQSMYHPVGTCRMGNDADAVVDAELRVNGLRGLRVVDASIMPRIPSGNTNAPTIMIAEKASDLLLGARRVAAPATQGRPVLAGVRTTAAREST